MLPIHNPIFLTATNDSIENRDLLVKLEHPVPRERKTRPYPHSPLGAEVQQSHPKRRLVEQRLGHRERLLPQITLMKAGGE